MSGPEPSILQSQLLQAQRSLELMQQFFREHHAREKQRLRSGDAARLERIRQHPDYARAYADEPLISVIIPTYNRARLIIERTLPSVLRQSYRHWELLIIGDQMNDDQAALLHEAAAGDPRVHFHNLKRRGRYPANKGPLWYVAGTKPVNFGLRVARGAWIAHLDDDDEFLPDHLAHLLRTAQAQRSEWAHGKVQFYDDNGREQGVVGNELPAHGGISRIGSLYHAGLKTFRYNGGCWKYFYPGDWDLWERLLDMGVRHTHLPDITAVHHGDYFRADVVADEGAITFTRRVLSPDEAYREWRSRLRLNRPQVVKATERNAAVAIDVAVIDPHGDVPALRRSLESLAAQTHHTFNVHVFSNHAPELAQGIRVHALAGDGIGSFDAWANTSTADLLLPLWAGDELDEHALLILADHVQAQPDLACWYVDEDAQGRDGYEQPLFKPDINLDLLRSYPYIGRTLAVRRELFVALGGWNDAYGPLAHVDFAFRVIEQIGLPAVAHIPEVIYHAGTAHAQWMSQPEVAEQSPRVVQAHLARLGVAHEMQSAGLPGVNRIRYIHEHKPLVSIIVPTRDQLPMLNGLIDSLIDRTRYPRYELLIVDNDSRDPAACAYLDGIEKLGSQQVRVLRYPHPFNYSAINNFATAQARGEYLILLNNDTAILQGDWIEALLHHAQRPEVGIVGAKLHYPDGRIQHGGVVLGLRGPADHPFIGAEPDAPGYMQRLQVDQNYTAVTAACLMIRRSVYEEVGGLDEEVFKVSYNDVDLCLKVRAAGYLSVWTPYARLMHEGSVSQNKVDTTAQEAKLTRFRGEQRAMYRKWLPLLARDPAYNINLSLHDEGFLLSPQREMAWQPFARPLAPRILAHPADANGCGYYRIRHPFTAMQEAGLIEGSVSDRLHLPTTIERIDPQVIVYQRQLSDEQLDAIGQVADMSGAFRVYELDDLLTNLPLKSAHRGDMPKDIQKSLRRAMGMVDRFVVSTPELANAFSSLHSDIRVIRNRLPLDWWSNLDVSRAPRERPRVGWAGGISHRGDLELIADVVRDLADEVDWVFMGMCPDKLKPYVKEFHPGVRINQYPARLAALKLDLAVAPLEDNLFNACKSNLRLLEYGICGFPVVCSDIACYRDDLPVTRVKNRYKDWIGAIRAHLADRDALAWAGDRLREAVLRNWMLAGENLVEWRDAWTPG
ncbi:glycosyltransferase [Dyella sp.]|uniref:glycosyltransferase n=1 Tax=Dyella sp. TaxID=1869338 RepID=UPI002ED29CE2